MELNEGWLTVKAVEGSKTKRTVRVPIHHRLMALLKELPRTTRDWFFTERQSRKYPNGNHCLNTKHLNEDFQKTLGKLGIPVGQKNGGFTIHSLRRSFRTFTTNAGVPREVVDAWMGHASDRSMASVYYKLSDEDSQMFVRRVPFGTGKSEANADREV